MLTGIVQILIAYLLYIAQRDGLLGFTHDGPIGAILGATIVLGLVYPLYIMGGICLFLAIVGGEILWPSIGELQRPEGSETYLDGEKLSALLGAEGQTISNLMPIGQVCINEAVYTALSEDGVIDSGTPVRVVGFHCQQLKVKQLEK